MEIKLSILIPGLWSRTQSANAIFMSAVNQFGGNKPFCGVRLMNKEHISPFEWYSDDSFIEMIHFPDEKELTIGEKRELMYKQARGIYSWQIDDDDAISDDSLHLILDALKDDPDCITFKEKCIINGSHFTSNHSIKYDDWSEKQDGFDYVRTPFFKSVIKTEIARSVPVPHIRFGEDHEWAKALKPHLKSEVHIDKELYIYQHNSKPENHNERYGFDRD